jgi:hypothetical protein
MRYTLPQSLLKFKAEQTTGSRLLAELPPILLKCFRRNGPAKRIGLHVTIGCISCAILAPAPPMPPSEFDEVASLNQVELGLPFRIAFCAAPGKLPVPFQLRNIFAHGGNIMIGWR